MPRIDLIQLRRDSAANWESADPVLAPGEIGVEEGDEYGTPPKIKIGDEYGTSWNGLPYLGDSQGLMDFDIGFISSNGLGDMRTQTIILEPNLAPSSPALGQLYFDGTHFYGWNGTTWKQLDN